MTNEIDVYRFTVRISDKDRFMCALSGIRPNENKIHYIWPGNTNWRVDIGVTQEELTFLELSFNFLNVAWIQQYEDTGK